VAHHHAVLTMVVKRMRVIGVETVRHITTRLHCRLVTAAAGQQGHHGPSLHGQGQQQEPQDQVMDTARHG
jgi:hypothetical protein